MLHEANWLAQHFLKDPRLVASIVAQAHLCRHDVVYEIGPGKGIITRELAKVCSRVIAIEIDPGLFAHLIEQFRGNPRIELHNGDFLDYQIRGKNYKVFSSIPYNATAAIVRKILHRKNPPAEACLIMQKEAADRFTGASGEGQLSLLLKPWFSLDIVRRFQRRDFEPAPGVDSVLLRIVRRDRPLVSAGNARLYKNFMECGFGRGHANLKQNFRHVFTYPQWKRLAQELGFHVNARPSDLDAEQWLAIFRFFLERKPGARPPTGWRR